MQNVLSTPTLEKLLTATLACAQTLQGHETIKPAHLVEIVGLLEDMHREAQKELIARGGGPIRPLVLLNNEAAVILETLGQVGFKYSLNDTISHILTGFVDGVKRPASWERTVVNYYFPEAACEQAIARAEAIRDEAARAKAAQSEG